MESRKITIVSTKTQKKSVIMSEAETLGELKRDLDNARIDYSDMTFYEGTSKTELKTDDSVLPRDVPYTNRTTGETKNTNELVFMLTNTNKKIKSGMNYNRKHVYELIKKHNLKDKIQENLGLPYTNCSTDALNAELQKLITVVPPKSDSSTDFCKASNTDKYFIALRTLVDILVETDTLSNYDRERILYPESVNKSPYSDEEISEMLDDLEFC